MPAPLRPAATKAYLRENWVYVPTIAGAAGPSVAEVTGASALDITNMVYASSARPTLSTNLARTERRLGDDTTFEFVGESQLTMGELQYSFNPQGAAASDGKKAYEKFPNGTSGFLVHRLGIPKNTDFASGQFVTVYPVEFGPQHETVQGDGESAEVAVVQSVAITGPKRLNVTVTV